MAFLSKGGRGLWLGQDNGSVTIYVGSLVKGGAMTRKILASILSVTAMAIACAACKSHSLIGEWRRTDKDEQEKKKKDGTVIVTGQNEVMVVKWRTEKDKLIMDFPLLDDAVIQYYKVSGSTLTTTNDPKSNKVTTYKRIY
jgi:hypothetical protein